MSLESRKGKLRTQRATRGLECFRSRLTALLVTLSLVAQLFAAPFHQALAAPAFSVSDSAAIAADLKAVFGDAASFCVRADDQGRPSPQAPCSHCVDQCLLCRFTLGVVAFAPPDAQALPGRPCAGHHVISFPPDFGGFSACLAQPNRARAPPLPV